MKITWRGHASFLIEAGGKRIITDPFNAELGYPLKPIAADLITLSHGHWDHSAVETISGSPHIIRGMGEHREDGIIFKGIASWHDRNKGGERGSNTIFKISAEGINLVHLGDLGHLLSTGQVQEIGPVDILLIPVGGTFTINAAEALKVIKQLDPRIVIPMHFSTPHLSFKLAPLEEFTSQFDQVIKKPTLEVQADGLGEGLRVMVLDYLCS